MVWWRSKVPCLDLEALIKGGFQVELAEVAFFSGLRWCLKSKTYGLVALQFLSLLVTSLQS